MNFHLKKEDVVLQIRSKLRIDQVKLWLPPYYDESSGILHDSIKQLAATYSDKLHLDYESCYETLLEMQHNSLENLKQRNVFSEFGLATLKIKVLQLNSTPKTFSKQIFLTNSGNNLRDIIVQEVDIPVERLKLISNGKVINDSDPLNVQGIKNGQLILAIVLSETPIEAKESEEKVRELEEIKTDSRLLALDNKYMQIEDQFGNVVKIPPEEKKSLIVAMTLNEKGKAALRREDYSRALIFFLEADEEFKHCNSQLLKSVDNYALLDLDIAWCYLCLQSVSNLPEAYERLKRCEERFHQSYGPNLERLIAVKGTPGNEAALFMRLHLLQAILLYHQNKRDQALQLLRKAERELDNLKVDEDSVLALVELGYSTREARLALRVTNGDINHAANYINQNRENRAESRRKAMAAEILQREKEKLGKCKDGQQYVDPNFLQILVNMGYNKEVARKALQQCNNSISDSTQYIQENPSPGPSGTRSEEMFRLVEELIPQLTAAGFDPRMAKLALNKHLGDIMKAAEELLANNGIIEGDLSALEDVGQSSLEDIKRKNEEKKEAFLRLSQDIDPADDDHLDLTLQQEEMFLKQYLDLLEKKPGN